MKIQLFTQRAWENYRHVKYQAPPPFPYPLKQNKTKPRTFLLILNAGCAFGLIVEEHFFLLLFLLFGCTLYHVGS